MVLENDWFCTLGGPLAVYINSVGKNEGLLRLGECLDGIKRLNAGDFNEKIRTKMVLENGRFCTLRGPPTVEITSLGENEGLLRLGEY